MRIVKYLACAGLMALAAMAAAPGQAATAAAGRHRDTLLKSENLFPLWIGADVRMEKRDVDIDGGTVGELRSRQYLGYIACDIRPWATVFGTIGAAQTSWHDDDAYADPGFAWSAGLRMALWHIDVKDPDFLTGRLSLSLAGEYARKKSGESARDTAWTEYFGAVYAGYELFTTKTDDAAQIPYSLILFVGPCVSRLDGSISATGVADCDFSEHQLFGVVGGLELYAARNLSFSAQIQHIGQPGFGLGMRYQF